MHAAFLMLVLLMGFACVPSIVLWLLATFLMFSTLKTGADLAFGLLVLPAGWWGWASLIWAACSATSFPGKSWPLWVRLGLGAGTAVVVGMWIFLGAAQRLSVVVLMGGPCVALALLLVVDAHVRTRLAGGKHEP